MAEVEFSTRDEWPKEKRKKVRKEKRSSVSLLTVMSQSLEISCNSGGTGVTFKHKLFFLFE